MFDVVRIVANLIGPRERLLWVLSAPLTLAAAVLEGLGAAAVFALIRLIGQPATVGGVPMAGVLDRLLRTGENPRTTVLIACGAVALLYIAKTLAVAASVWFQSRATAESSTALSHRLLVAYLGAPWAWHLQRNSAELVARTLEESDLVFRNLVAPAVSVLSEGLIVLGIVMVLVLTAPGVTMAAATVLLVVLALVVRGTRQILTAWGKRAQHLRHIVLQTLQQTLGSLKEVKLRGREDFLADRFAAQHRELVRLYHRYTTVSAASRMLIEAVFIGAMLLVVVLLALRRETATTVIPVLGLYGYAGFRIIPSVNRILMHLNSVRYTAPTVESLHADLERCERMVREQRAVSSDVPVVFNDRLELDGVGYCYEGAGGPVLRDVSVTIHHGESVGIVGATGVGKSTLLSLVMGLLSSTAGSIRVDGTDIVRALAGWQRKIGYVPQGVYLLDDTLRRNIAFAVPDEQIDAARLRAAVRMAQLDDVVDRLPQGLDSFLGERGVRMSGGEQQRVAIARALYQEPELLVFDEATAAVDNQTEREITRAIESLRGQKTLLIVAHRLSTVRSCDRLIFLRDGSVEAIGSFDELLRSNAAFRDLVAAADPDPSAAADA